MFDLSPVYRDFLASGISAKEALVALMRYSDPKRVDEIKTFDTVESIAAAKGWFEEGIARFLEMPPRQVFLISLDDGCDYYFDAYACEGRRKRERIKYSNPKNSREKTIR